MEQIEMTETLSNKKRKPSRKCQALFIILCIVILFGGLGVGLYFALRFPTPSPPQQRSAKHVPCPKLVGMTSTLDYTKDTCQSAWTDIKTSDGEPKLGCEWLKFPETDEIPYRCAFVDKERYLFFQLLKNESSGVRARMSHESGANFYHPYVEVTCRSQTQLKFKIHESGYTFMGVPDEALHIEYKNISCGDATYEYSLDKDRLTVTHNGIVMFEVPFTNLVLERWFQQIQVKLDSSTNYGFGEHNHKRWQLDMNYKTWSIFTRDVGVVDDWNLYGAHPFFISYSKNLQSTMGVLLLNSYPMDVYLQPNPYPSVTYRTIGYAPHLEFYLFFSSDGPEAVVQDYTSLIGRSVMPPYWSLGFHQSRWGYKTLDDVKEMVERNQKAQIPMDVIYGDIDYMSNKLDFTYDSDRYNGLPAYVDELKMNGTKYIIILDPGIGIQTENFTQIGRSYKALNDGLRDCVFIREAAKSFTTGNGLTVYPHNGTFVIGEVWPGKVHYPDFTMDSTQNWWTEQVEDFYYNNRSNTFTGVHFDGLWVDMNEVSNFRDAQASDAAANGYTACRDNSMNNPKVYIPEKLLGNKLTDKTICMDAEHHGWRYGRQGHYYTEYQIHSLYGHTMAMTTYRSLKQLFPRTRPFVLTRSTFVGTNKYAHHWLGDNQSFWEHLRWSIVGMLEFNMFGFPLVGADICGFWFEPSEELCQRWMQVGAFYPYARNHNGRGEEKDPIFRHQDPAAWNETTITSSREALMIRYKLLPYLYTLMYNSHANGNTVARALSFEFYKDPETHNISTQFLWGSAFLISPALFEGQISVRAYLPRGLWYNYHTHEKMSSEGMYVDLDTPREKINLHIRGGYILPWQYPALNTKLSRENGFGLTVALDEQDEANGELYLDDGDSLDPLGEGNYTWVKFRASGSELVIVNQFSGYNVAQNCSEILILGVSKEILSVYVNGQVLDNARFSYSSASQVLTIRPDGLRFDGTHLIRWN